MKCLLIIFSLYMTMLTVLPCQDSADFGIDSQEASSLKKTSNGVEHYGQETCPPFCTCACCSISRNFPVAKDPVTILSFIQTPYTKYCVPSISEKPIEIYQPPKVA